ncbi:MAG: SgcJ/EcaC family oxidoreductase [Alphaproteobacteria bacterium]|nr:SgcJ/EcaC family oxidoreductase [Alphaproteobacteria bacterium]
MISWRLVAAAAAALPLLACGGDHGEAKHGGGNAKGEAHAPVPSQHGLPSKAEIAALFDEWNATLQTGGPHDMALLYAEDGVLLPTVSNDVRSNRAEIADYFEHFLKLKPRGVINEQHIDVLDWNTAVNSGVYTFDMVKDGQPTFVVARYNFIYERVGAKWLIKSHHSSAMPEAVTERPPTLAQVLGEPTPRAGYTPASYAPDAGHGEAAADHGETHAEPAHDDHAAPAAKAKKAAKGHH